MRIAVAIILALTVALAIPITSHDVFGYGGGGGSGDGGAGDATATRDRGDSDNPPSGFESTESAEEASSADETAEGQSAESESGTETEEDASGQADEQKDSTTTTDSTEPSTGQPPNPESLIGTKGTLPGTRNATVEKVDTTINKDGSVSTWTEYSNDTWVETTVAPDGTASVVIHLDSGTVIRPDEQTLYAGGSINPALDFTISVLEYAAAAGTAAGWVLSVTPQGALASAGIKGTKAVWATTVGIQSLRAGTDAYASRINAGASQSEAVATGLKQTAVTATVTTAVGRARSPEDGAVAQSVVDEIAHNQVNNEIANKVTEGITGYAPGSKPW
jgi:hypothetical protein